MFARSLLAAALLLSLAACGATPYVITTKTGLKIPAQGKPKFDAEEGIYSYRNSDGKDATIMREDVATIHEK
jgi:hypothetical protein